MATVSIVIPTYNCAQYLPKAIESVLAQTYTDFELIVVDDNSTDTTQEYLSSIQDRRLRVLKTQGVGASEARNWGVRVAHGEYVAFLDADDFWFQEKLATQVELHQRYPSLGMSFTNYDHLTEAYQSIVDCFGYWNQFGKEHKPYLKLDEPLDFVMSTNVIGTSTVMVKRDVFEQVGMFIPEIAYAEDWDLWLRISENFDIGVVNSIQVGYLMRQGSATQTDSRRADNLRSVEAIISRYKEAKHNRPVSVSAFDKAQARVLEGYADFHRGQQRYTTAIWYGLRSLSLDPQKRRIQSLLGDCKQLVLAR